MRHVELNQHINNFKDSEVIWVVFCNILGWLRQEPLPYPQTDSESVAIRFLATATVAGLFAHRWPGVGRMQGCHLNIRVWCLVWYLVFLANTS